ncbi:MAG: hypothetical protein AAGI48_13730 [Verrucomicrobiota bacterium]
MNQRAATLLAFVVLMAPALRADPIQPENGFKYEPFYADRWEEKGIPTEMTAWKGEEIAFLTLNDEHDSAMMTSIVDRLDKGWATYRDLVGQDPRPFKMMGELPIIAAIPEGLSCGAGCGFVGATGVELCLFYSRDLTHLKKDPTAVPHYIYYEMGRNFYVFGERHSYFATGFAVFMRYVCMDATKSTDVEAWERKEIEGFEAKVKEAKQLSFLEIFTSAGDETRRKHGRDAGLSDSQNSNHASVMLYLRKTQGGDEWIKRFYKAMPSADSFPVNSEGAPYLQSLNWLVAASIASKKDLAPLFMERYRFPLPEGDATKLAAIEWDKKELSIAKIVSELSKTPAK